MDKLTKEQRSRTMSKIRSANTGFEKVIFRQLRNRGLRFRTHYSGVIGKPDIAQPKKRKAVFLHSDFWHGWQLPRWEKTLSSDFWKTKLRKNRERDKKVITNLRRLGWGVVVLWEHSYNKDSGKCIDNIANFLRS